jgi:HEAT repeat protein
MESLQALLWSLRIEDEEALFEVIDSLGKIGDSAAIVPLICLFHDTEDENLRLRIAMTLGKLSDLESADEILDLLNGTAQAGAN